MKPEELDAIEHAEKSLASAFITCVAGDGKHYVKFQFKTLKEAQDYHSFVVTHGQKVQSLVAEVRRLREAQQWQPIETAPRDGTHFLAYQKPSLKSDQSCYECWLQKDDYDGDFWQDDCDSEPSPTHWMPLPKSPVQS